MRQLSENEVRQFYIAYRDMEATAHTLKDKAEWFHREAIKSALQRNLLLFVVLTFFFGVGFYHAVL
jgi:hypothetical protein